MVDEIITRQELIDAQKDAQSLDEFINGGDEQIVVTRLLKEYPTLANAIRQIYEKGGKFYTTLAAANADIANIRTDVYVVTGDNGAYYKATAEATSLTKSPYDPVEQAKNFTQEKQLETLKSLTQEKAKILTQKNLNSYINANGGVTAVSGKSIWSYTVKPHEVYRIVNPISYLSSSHLQRSYAFYSTTTVSESSFISGGVASNAARTADDTVIVPENAVMLCVGNNATLTAEFYKLDLAQNEETKSLVTSSAKNSVVLRQHKHLHNTLDCLFEKEINFYRDLSLVKTAPIPINSNTTDAKYNFCPRIANEDTTPIAFTSVNDPVVGYMRKYSANYGSPASTLITLLGIFKKTKIYFGLKIASSAVTATTTVEIADGSGGTSRFNLLTGVADATYQNNTEVSEFQLVEKSGDYYIYSCTYAGSTAASKHIFRPSVRTSPGTGTFEVGLFGLKTFDYNDGHNYYLDSDYSNTAHSPFLQKNLMFFGDSQSRGNIAFEFQRQLGCNVYWNAAGGRAMQYRSGQSAATDLNWLYHWTRRQHIVNAIASGGDFDLYVFNVSYNDGSGGGTLSDAAVQAVLDNYPTITDDAATVTAKLATFNALTEAERISIFGYKQTFAAMLKQIIEYQPNAKIFLTTMLYNPQGNGTPEQQRALNKATRDSCNAQIREIASWFGVSVIDTASHAGHYFGNMKTHVSDGLHFDEVIGQRIGYYTAKNILMQTI